MTVRKKGSRLDSEEPRRRRALTGVRPDAPIDVAGDEEARELLADALRAADPEKRDTLTHGFHSWAGRMHPRVARSLLASFAPAGGVLLDPFAGSGTVLLEAMVRGHPAIGVDLNPLAALVAAVKCERRDSTARERFRTALVAVARASEERVRSRVDSRAPISPRLVHSWDGHVIKELAGLREEILAVADERDRRALLVTLSAIVVKVSRQKADTSDEQMMRRIRKGLPTELFARKGMELYERWEALYAAAPREVPDVRILVGDARDLPSLLGRTRADVVVTSPPYGGTYDYAEHHALRVPWLGLDDRQLHDAEIGARRSTDTVEGWDEELGTALDAIVQVTRQDAPVVLVLGDGETKRGERIAADVQLERLAPQVGLEPIAIASQRRADHHGGAPRAEHLALLVRK